MRLPDDDVKQSIIDYLLTQDEKQSESAQLLIDAYFEIKRIDSLLIGLLDMIEGGRLTEDMIPDDWQWLVKMLRRNNRMGKPI